MTALEPGDRDVFTYFGIVNPYSIALRARRDPPIITSGLEVFVHEVIAAITNDPL